MVQCVLVWQRIWNRIEVVWKSRNRTSQNGHTNPSCASGFDFEGINLKTLVIFVFKWCLPSLLTTMTMRPWLRSDGWTRQQFHISSTWRPAKTLFKPSSLYIMLTCYLPGLQGTRSGMKLNVSRLCRMMGQHESLHSREMKWIESNDKNLFALEISHWGGDIHYIHFQFLAGYNQNQESKKIDGSPPVSPGQAGELTSSVPDCPYLFNL